MMVSESYMKLAIEEAHTAIRARAGGPFGAVIVLNEKIIGRGHNTVLQTHDPTAHAEMNAIRNASANLENHHLTGAVIYTNFEPCPMCLSAIYWADIREICYCADRNVAKRIGFMDSDLYEEFTHTERDRSLKSTQIELKEMDLLLKEWDGMEGKVFY
jgi:tRNA(Arg) A34 adenosine deaminase TadA